MFGISTFSQTTYAGLPLGGNQFVLSISEDLQPNDSNSQTWAFLQSITEPIIINNVQNDAGVNYFGSATEAITLGDSSTQLSTFLQSLSENFNSNNNQTISAQFAALQTENFTPADSSVQYFAALETRSEPIDNIADSSIQQIAFLQNITENTTENDILAITAQFASSITENITLADAISIAAQFAVSRTEPATNRCFPQGMG